MCAADYTQLGPITARTSRRLERSVLTAFLILVALAFVSTLFAVPPRKRPHRHPRRRHRASSDIRTAWRLAFGSALVLGYAWAVLHAPQDWEALIGVLGGLFNLLFWIWALGGANSSRR